MQNWVLNLVLFSPAVILGIWYPHVGEVGAVLAAFSAMLVIYFLPLMTYLKMKKQDIELLVQANSDNTTSSNDEEINETQSREDLRNIGRPTKYQVLLVGSSLLMMYGVFAFAAQLYYLYDQAQKTETLEPTITAVNS